MDEWDNCYDGRLTKTEFADTFCSVCVQPACNRSAINRASWIQRMSTQVDRLLENPKFADPRDARWDNFRRLDFPSAMRQAVTAELVNQRGDWTIPTEADVRAASSRMVPTMFLKEADQKPVPPPEVSSKKPPDESVPVGEPQYRVKGSDATYDVREVDGQWSCSCPAYTFGRARPCKHIEQVLAARESDQRAPPPPPPEVSRAPLVEPSATQVGRVFIPKFDNAPMQQSPLLLPASPLQGVSPTPAQDPWAIPTEMKVAVGGKVVMGGGK